MSRDLSGVSAPYTTMIGSLTSGAAFRRGSAENKPQYPVMRAQSGAPMRRQLYGTKISI
jgi:hypothetical protein